MLREAINFIKGQETSYSLSIPREEEAESILLLGDPGTGKSQIIHQFLDKIAQRRPAEAGICFDPACEFLEAHYDPATDIILNPLDSRFPYWSPSLEVATEIDLQLVAESLYPCSDRVPEPSRFFLMAARDIVMMMLAMRPNASTLVKWMCDEKFIDEMVDGTEIAHKINKKAGPQRVAVLSTLAESARLLKMLPTKEDCQKAMSLTNWAKRRRGWIFITSTQDTRDALRPLQAAFLNILMKRLLSVDRAWGRENPCWLVIDEVHALKYLPALPTFMVECRKYGVKTILGTQSKFQMREHYGETAGTMLAAPHLKIYLRSNESEAAQWIANNIGEEERERPRVGATEALEARGRDSTNYSTSIERRMVVSKEQIMQLQNLHGYWKYADAVVPFRINARDYPAVTKGYIPRPASAPAKETVQPVSTVSPPPAVQPPIVQAPPLVPAASKQAKPTTRQNPPAQPTKLSSVSPAGDAARQNKPTPQTRKAETPPAAPVKSDELDLDF